MDLHETAMLVLVVVSAVLSLGALALCGVIVFWAMRDARHALDVIVRHQDNAAGFYRKAVAESIAKGKTNLVVAPPQDEGGGQKTPVGSALAGLRAGIEEDAEELGGE